ncbi:MAG: hypothetical protein WBC49_03595 [Thermoplasmata archaeon]
MAIHINPEVANAIAELVALIFKSRGPDNVLREILGKVRKVRGVRSIRFISTSRPIG